MNLAGLGLPAGVSEDLEQIGNHGIAKKNMVKLQDSSKYAC
jgi:hypothetical protein